MFWAEIIASGQEGGIVADAIAVLDRATDKATQPIRVLHVEDDPTIAGLIQEISEHEGWEVEHCVDGTTALKALASDTDYDVLLVDYELPGVNGLELVQQARSMVHRQDLRIIMMSGTSTILKLAKPEQMPFCGSQKILDQPSRRLIV